MMDDRELAPEERVPCDPPTPRQLKQLLDTCFYYMDGDLRGKLLRELPQAYNAYVGWRVVEVTHRDGRVA